MGVLYITLEIHRGYGVVRCIIILTATFLQLFLEFGEGDELLKLG